MRSLALTVAAVIGVFVGRAFAEEPTWWERLRSTPGATVSTRTDPDGSETEMISLPSGVTFERIRKGDEIETTGVDESGHGAVLCLWGIYNQTKNFLEICRPRQYPDLERDIAKAIARIEDFIVANNLTPVTKEQLREHAAKEAEPDFSAATKMSKTELQRRCDSGEGAAFLDSFIRESRRPFWRMKFEKQIDELLSVPRPPVMNPCL